jgi:hypothetical protein
MKKEECINLFNTKIKEFIQDLNRVYPDDDDLLKFKTSINILLLVNDKQLIKMYKDMVYMKYKDQIMKNEEDFFMNHDYVEERGEHTEEFTDRLISKIKSYWKTMNDENKEIVWSYFILMTKLCEKYVNM